jgi:hypothetical protein
MDNSVIRFPVKCPCCEREFLVARGLHTIVIALATGRRLILTSNCVYHRAIWVANEIERNQIQEYAAALYFSMSGQSRRPRAIIFA